MHFSGRVLFIVIFIGIIDILGFCALFLKLSEPLEVYYQQKDVDVVHPIDVTFSREVDSGTHISLEGNISGSWKLVKGIFGIQEAVFYPSTRLEYGKIYTIRLSNIRSMISLQAPKTQFLEFSTAYPPSVRTFSLSDLATNVPINSQIRLALSKPNLDTRVLTLHVSPVVPTHTIIAADDMTFTWQFIQNLKQGTTYHLVVRDENQDTALIDIQFTTVSEPKLIPDQRDDLVPGNQITIAFAQDMIESMDAFSFPMVGKGLWITPQKYVYEPSNLAVATGYTYTVKKGIRSVLGGVLETDQNFHISTPGVINVVHISPNGDGMSRTPIISVTFNEPVNTQSVQSHFMLSPSATVASYHWDGNTVSIATSPLAWQTTYTATITPGIAPIFGLANTNTFTTTFTTEAQTVILPIPFYYQQYAESCEEASLRMALAYRGIHVSDYDVLTQVGYNPHPRDMVTNSWDDPYVQFVGDVNGNQETGTGWGTYSDPIAKASKHLGRNALAFHGTDPSMIATQLYNGNPVIIWGYYSSASVPDSWNTPDGIVSTIKGAHVRLVVGVYGSASNPIGFYVNDPIWGQLYWSKARLEDNLYKFGSASDQAVVVY